MAAGRLGRRMMTLESVSGYQFLDLAGGRVVQLQVSTVMAVPGFYVHQKVLDLVNRIILVKY